MNYEAWRISYQSSEQAARAAFSEWQKRPAECEPVGCFFKNDRGFWHQAGDPVGFKGLTKLYAAPQPCPDCLKWATDMSQVTKTLRYLIGIAERGTATTLPDGVTVESFVLDYVKGLETKVEHMRKELKEIDAAINDPRVNLTVTVSEAIVELTKERDKERLVGDKLSAKLTRAEAVIEKCSTAINSDLNPCGCFNGCEFCNGKATLEEALAAITEYRDGK